ncbi:MAG: sulfatase-like hydrolase/transferase [Caldilineaceae bacterium]
MRTSTRRTSRSSSTMHPAAPMRPTRSARNGSKKYKGKFDRAGTSIASRSSARQKELGIFPADAELSARDPDVPEWSTLTDQQKVLYARFMEVFAGFLEHCDLPVPAAFWRCWRPSANWTTRIMVIPDNGASSEGGVNGAFNEMSSFNYYWETMEDILPKMDQLGGPSSYNHYPWGWSWAGNTPFRRWKKEVYRGGSTDNLIVHWPAGITARGENRHQYGHAIDLVPTVLDVLGVEPPAAIRGVAQSPIEGVSFAHTFDQPDAPSNHHTQYFEMFGGRAINHDGWRAVCGFPGRSYAEGEERGYHFGDSITPEILDDLDANGWQLFHVAVDPAESRDLAAQHPEKVTGNDRTLVCGGR